MKKLKKVCKIQKRKISFSKKAVVLTILVFLLNISLYADPTFDSLVGVYRGIFTNSDGINSIELMVFKNANNYQAVVIITTNRQGTQISGSYLANVLYNASTSQFEIVGASSVNMPSGMEYVDFRCALSGSTLYGNAGSSRNYNNGWNFSVNKIASSNYRYTGPHEHVAANSQRVITQPTCSRTGIRVFDCIFCNTEARRENIQRLRHTAGGDWIISKAADCSEEGERIRRCRDCNEEAVKEAIPKLPHKPDGNWLVEKESMCNEAGKKVQYCTDCKEEALSEEIPPFTDSDHVFVKNKISGGIFFPPIVEEEVCSVCGFIGEQHSEYKYACIPIILILIIISGTIFGIVYWKKKTAFVCPFCLENYNKNKVQYKCPDCGELSKRGFLEFKRVKCKNSSCGNWAIIRQCPKCGEEIPKTALETPNLPFSIIGVSGSGKTNYITVLLNELGRFSDLRLILSSQNTATKNHQNDNYKRIYKDHTKPESTARGLASLIPQIWQIKNDSKRSGKVPTYTFTIFDGAGEDHEQELKTDSNVCRYIKSSKAIILLIDPLILKHVQENNSIDKDILRDSSAGKEIDNEATKDVVSAVAEYIKSAYGIFSNARLTIPVAVVLAKFDVIRNEEAFNNALITKKSKIINESKFNMNEVIQVNNDIRKWLEDIGEGQFINTIEGNFKNFYFFGVSSYGEPPKGGTLPNIVPHRVLDPVLWLFKMAKFID